MSWLRGDRTDRYRAVTRENPRAASVEAADLLGSLSDALRDCSKETREEPGSMRVFATKTR